MSNRFIDQRQKGGGLSKVAGLSEVRYEARFCTGSVSVPVWRARFLAVAGRLQDWRGT